MDARRKQKGSSRGLFRGSRRRVELRRSYGRNKINASAANHDPGGRLHSINQEGRPTLLILGCKNSLVYFRAQIFLLDCLQKLFSLFKYLAHDSLDLEVLSYNDRPMFRTSGFRFKYIVVRAFS